MKMCHNVDIVQAFTCINHVHGYLIEINMVNIHKTSALKSQGYQSLTIIT